MNIRASFNVLVASTMVIVIAGCSLWRSETDEETNRNRTRQLEEAIKTYQESAKTINTSRQRELTTEETPTAAGGKVTKTLEVERTLSEEVATVRSQLEKTQQENERLREEMKRASEMKAPAGMDLLTLVGGLLTGGGGAAALFLPKIMGLLGRCRRFTDAIQGIKDEVGGDKETPEGAEKRKKINAVAQQHLDSSDKAFVDRHKASKKPRTK